MISFSSRLTRPRFGLDVQFEVPGGCVALFGASGSGKTTVTRLIAGLERPDSGRIVIDGHVLVDTDAGIHVPVHRRRVGLVFQEGQLLPHLSVRQNLDYGRRFAPDGSDRIAFDAVVELLGIGHLLAARPATLSGGERQRVAIGRALLASPRVLVMDEPLASLDSKRKLEILPFIERLRDQFSIPIVYVSHAVDEVARLATHIVRLANGRVIAQGLPDEVLSIAASDTASDRFDVVSILSGQVMRQLPDFAMTVLGHPSGDIVLPGRFGTSNVTVKVLVRATNVVLATEKPKSLSVRTVLKGQVRSVAETDPASALVTVDLVGGERIAAYLTRLAVADLALAEGREVYALVKTVSLDEGAIRVA